MEGYVRYFFWFLVTLLCEVKNTGKIYKTSGLFIFPLMPNTNNRNKIVKVFPGYSKIWKSKDDLVYNSNSTADHAITLNVKPLSDPGTTRTFGPQLRRLLLYPLSYGANDFCKYRERPTDNILRGSLML